MEKQGNVFVTHMLFREKPAMPSKTKIREILEKHLGKIEITDEKSENYGFAALEFICKFSDGNVPVMLNLLPTDDMEGLELSPLQVSQFRNVANPEEILNNCGFRIIGVDMLGDALADYKDRARLCAGYVEAMFEAFPQMLGMYVHNSESMITHSDILNQDEPLVDKVLQCFLNVRFYNIEGKSDFLIDTVGMGLFRLPDLQYHFHNLKPNDVVNHCYNVAYYIFENDCPIENGHTIDGIFEGQNFGCHFEDSLIEPPRFVMDLDMGEFASGSRNYE